MAHIDVRRTRYYGHVCTGNNAGPVLCQVAKALERRRSNLARPRDPKRVPIQIPTLLAFTLIHSFEQGRFSLAHRDV